MCSRYVRNRFAGQAVVALTLVLMLCRGGWLAGASVGGETRAAGEERPEESGAQQGSKQLTRIRAAVEDGAYDLAGRLIREGLSRDALKGNEPAALELLCRSLYERGNFREIIKTVQADRFEQFLSEGDRSFWLALARYELGNLSESLSMIKDFASDYPKSPHVGRAITLEAWIYLEKDMVDRAISTFDQYVREYRQDPEYSAALVDWGKALIQEGLDQEARSIFEKAAESSEGGASVYEARYWLGKLLLDQGELVRSRELLEPLSTNRVVRSDVRAKAWYARALIHEIKTEADKAEHALRQGNQLARDPDLRRKGNYELGSLLLRMRRIDEAKPLLREYISAYPDKRISAMTQLQLAESLASADRHKEAIGEFTKYVETFTNRTGRANAYEGKGWALNEISRYSEAAAAFEKACGIYTGKQDRARCMFKMADSYLANEQYAPAREGYERIMEMFPGNSLEPRARYQIAESFYMQGNTEAAENAFRSLVEDYPENEVGARAALRLPELKLQLARKLEEEGRRTEATERYHSAIDGFRSFMNSYDNESLYAAALHGRGVARYRLFWFRKALDDFQRVVDEFPEQEVAPQAFYMRGMCWYGMVEDDKALDVWHEFIRKYPESEYAPEVLFWAAKAEYNSGRFQEAMSDFSSLADDYPDSPLADDALLWAGRAASELNEYVNANDILTSLIKQYPNSDRLAEARFEQADTLSALGDFENAILVFDEIINKFPDSDLVPAAWGRKGDCQFTLGTEEPGRYKESIESFRVVADSPDASRALVLQAEYKIGRSLEKLGRTEKAFEQYYVEVILRYLEQREEGVWHNESSKVWFSRAAFNAVDILVGREEWRRAVKILERVIAAGVPTAETARARIREIKSEHWWLF